MIKKKTEILEIFLGDILVGYLSHTRDGKNVFIFDESYIELGNNRPRLSLSFKDEDSLRKPWTSTQALPSFFSNLLPEGDFREYISKSLNVKDANEFALFKALSADCPGNIIVKSETENSIPEINHESNNATHKLDRNVFRFSLAGVQLKFSALFKDGRYTLRHLKQAGNVIIKMPSAFYPCLPENEYSMMRLAQSIGIHIPEIRLISISEIPNLAHFQHLKDKIVYTINRFDRTPEGGRIHCEDFAQVIGARPAAKYDATNYDTIARIIKETFKDGLNQLEQFLMRLYVNILLGNTDAHLKNWTVCYPDGKTPELAPAYDIVSTLEYIPSNVEQALNMAKTKKFYEIDKQVLIKFANRIDVDEKFVLNIADQMVERANSEWPKLLASLPITSSNQAALMHHWKKLKKPFAMSSLAGLFSKTSKTQ